MAGKQLGALLAQARARAGLVDASAAVLLSAFALAALPAHVNPAAAAACGLVATSSVGWRRRAPGVAVVVAGAGLAGYAWLAGASPELAEPSALLLVMYTAGARGVSRRQVGQLVALVGYGIAVCALVDAAAGPVSISAVAVHALPLAIAPAVAGYLVARQRDLAERLAAATGRLRAGEQARLAVVRIRERNRVARDLHDVVAHGVSVMVVQAGAARITLGGEPDLARAALAEVAATGRTGQSELRRILGVIGGDHDGPEPPPAVAGIVALAERRRAGGLPVEVRVTGTDPGFPAAVDAALYRLVQETLTNVIKHARSAPTDVDVVIEPAVLQVRVRNSAPPDTASAGSGAACAGAGAACAGSGAASAGPVAAETIAAAPGHGLVGMRERVESCGGRLWYGTQPDGGFEVRARFPLVPVAEEGAGEEGPRRPGRLTGWLRVIGPWALALALFADACADADRRGPLALNVALVAGMAVALVWRRRFPLGFLVAVNLLALPISNGLTSIDNPTLVSTFIFVVPVWTVAAWSSTGIAVAGLVLAAGFDTAEGIYWHLGAASIVPNVLLTAALWIVGRVVHSQRLTAAGLERTRSQLEAGQQAREALTLAAERTRMVARLHSLVAGEIAVMVAAAGTARDLIGTDSAAAAALAGQIERDGRQALARLREILGLLRSEYDPAPLSPGLRVEHIQDLIARSAQEPAGAPAELDVSGVPVPLPKGVDVVAYRVVAEILAAAACTAVGVRFGEHRLFLDFALTGRAQAPGRPSATISGGSEVLSAPRRPAWESG